VIEQYDPVKGEMLQILDEKGTVLSSLEPHLSPDALKTVYRKMVMTREADQKSFKLQRQGRMGTFAPCLGHEACQVGSAFALSRRDWFFPYFRDLGSYITLGFPLSLYFLYWMGNEKGMQIPPHLNIFTLAISVASHLPHAVGAGMAAMIKGEELAILSTFGDGATSEGDFHEALNMAGVHKSPNVFLCYNNQYAISTPVKKQTASHSLAQKAIAYGFDGVLVDGNDVLAIYAVTTEALQKARKGGGPTLIEAYTYRLSSHTTSDDAAKYRSETETEEWKKKDPIDRFRIYLRNKGLWSQSFENEVRKKVEEEVEAAVKEAEETPPPSVEDLFAFTYKEMPSPLRDQLEELEAFIQKKKP
jgi:pyruvate dehydrogenase E1 component alpha subunit